jgi:hypothetical protein
LSDWIEDELSAVSESGAAIYGNKTTNKSVVMLKEI